MITLKPMNVYYTISKRFPPNQPYYEKDRNYFPSNNNIFLFESRIEAEDYIKEQSIDESIWEINTVMIQYPKVVSVCDKTLIIG